MLTANLFWINEKGKVKRALEKAYLPLQELPKLEELKVTAWLLSSFLLLMLFHFFVIVLNGGSSFRRF